MSGTNGKAFPYPGIPTTSDGAGAVAWVETHITQGACAYPITSSTTMGQGYQAEVANGKENLWGEKLFFLELESEHSSASTCEGYAVAGGRVSNFTSGQGLILMKEVLYTISGKRLPVVFHIGARALTSQSLNVHAGHDDVMGVTDCGWSMFFARTAQETGDLALIARRVAEDSETPVLNIQDGFLTTHTVENVSLPEPEFMKSYIGPAGEKTPNLMDFDNPIMSGVVQNQDAYMKGKIAQRYFYDKIPGIVKNAMDEFYEATGRRYDMVDSYRMEDAEYAYVGMGCYMETACATVDYLREQGVKIGLVNVTVFRPFPGAELVEALKGVKAFTILERLDVPNAQSNPLTAETKAAFSDALIGSEGYAAIDRIPVVFSASAGLGSRDVRPGDLIAVAHNMMEGGEGKRYFSIGIDHATALEPMEDPDLRPTGSFSMRGHSVGGYGSVTTNKVIATIAGDTFGLNVQAYPKYGSEKKGLPTTYYLTIAEDVIRTHCELRQVEFIPLNDVNALYAGNPLQGLSEGGMVFIQTPENEPEAVWENIPQSARSAIRARKTRIVYMDTVQVAREIASDPSLEQRMQGIVLLGIFLSCTPFAKEKGISEEEVFASVEKSIRKYFGRRGEQVVKDNMECVRRGYTENKEIPQELIETASTLEMVG
ncbi:MAG: pyruvate ferredoxin oxidoreductase [Nitrospinaceae bacterium]|nr:pyruvate ferredoxin oxidoreductase [Nitrospinaceae bacterium]MBT6394826.1 pyruvate ferredoxin oxidoreductase [Nitrospinaceae bacterium]